MLTGSAPGGVALEYPLLHVLLAPLTLTADWLNGGSVRDLTGFVVWAILVYVLARMAVRRPGARREAGFALLFAGLVVAFFAGAAFLDRPIPRLVAANPDVLVWDAHSHTAVSHDGRRGFDATQNAGWHERAGFGAAVVTDHNSYGAAQQWRREGAGRPPHLLDGEELSLSGLHLLVFGNGAAIANEPHNRSWDSTLALIRALSSAPADHPPLDPRSPILDPNPVFLVASLPEYWRHHWGEDLSDLVTSGVRGFEIWTSSPRAMALPPAARAQIIARARTSDLVLLGATDMHGLGRTASVWNVTMIPGWRALPDTALQRALFDKLAAEGFAANRVVALWRWMPRSRLGQAVAVPVNVLSLPARATWGHAVALLAWLWLGVLISRRRRPTPSP